MFKRMAFAGARALRSAARKLERYSDAQSISVRRSAGSHDMESDADERYYAHQYWHWLEPAILRVCPARDAHVLDIGCGQGRLSLRAAALLHRGHVTGVDLSGDAIATARRNAENQHLKNTEFHEGDALDFTRREPAGSRDIVLFTEISFLLPTFEQVIGESSRVLRKGGLFAAAFRSQFYNLLFSVRERDWPSARLVLSKRAGEWGGGSTWFSWQTAREIQQILAGAGLTIDSLHGVGVCSGIANDPLASIAQPSRMSERDRQQLMEIEIALAEDHAAYGRYILAMATKP